VEGGAKWALQYQVLRSLCRSQSCRCAAIALTSKTGCSYTSLCNSVPTRGGCGGLWVTNSGRSLVMFAGDSSSSRYQLRDVAHRSFAPFLAGDGPTFGTPVYATE
jgi:hypothetical protein